MSDFPHLDLLMDGYFHQDYDLAGGDVPEVVAAFVRDAGAKEAAATAADIRRFVAAGSAEGEAFSARYPDDVDPAGWDMTVAEWLHWVAGLLEATG